MSTSDPRPLADTDEALAAMADPHAYRQYVAGALPSPLASPFAPERLDAGPPRTLPAVPSWVQHPEKWLMLSRAERRALIAHHRREGRRGR